MSNFRHNPSLTSKIIEKTFFDVLRHIFDILFMRKLFIDFRYFPQIYNNCWIYFMYSIIYLSREIMIDHWIQGIKSLDQKI